MVLPVEYEPPRKMARPALRDEVLTTCRGIVIGGGRAPARPDLGHYGEKLQAALLEPRTARRATLLERIWGWL